MSELKSCPFCGRNQVTIEECDDSHAWAATCRHCDAEGPWQLEKDAAASSWNTRATPPRAEVDVGAVVREVADAMSRYSASIVQTAYVSDAVRRALALAAKEEA